MNVAHLLRTLQNDPQPETSCPSLAVHEKYGREERVRASRAAFA
jgi:hypothetical protein